MVPGPLLLSVASIITFTALAAPPATQPATQPAPVNEEALVELGHELEQAIAVGDADAFIAAWNLEAMTDRIMGRIDAPPGFKAGFREGFTERFEFAEAILQSMGDGGTFRFLRPWQFEGQPSLLFRLSGPQGLNYHNYLIGKDARGRLRVEDADILVTGEPLSRTMQRLYLQALMQFTKPRDKADDATAVLAPYQRSTELIQQGRWQELLDFYDGLPDRLKRQKVLQLHRIQAAGQLSEETLAQALTDYQKHFADDATAALVSLDLLLIRGEYEAALAALDRIDQAVGGDPYLNVLRANTMLAKGDTRAARECAHRAIQEEPDLLDARWSLVSASLRDKNHAETAALLTDLQEMGVEFLDLTTVPEYADFVKSSEYRQWIASQQPADHP